MAIGLGVLRLSPRDFWMMTPREFASAASPVSARRGGAPDRGALAALMADFPDRQEDEKNG
ncbi:MAG: phage tail assembly chaperone [Rhizobiales bacterium]|nr:phage tail assembly chaperone [Hyphomicrobiales bacterium]